MSELRILLADDHEIIRGGLISLLTAQPGWTVVGQASTGVEAVRLARELKPDIIIMDMTMPELNGLEATRQIIQELPHAEILILTVHGSEKLLRDVQEAGARGFVLKNEASRVMAQAVQSLAQHRPFFRLSPETTGSPGDTARRTAEAESGYTGPRLTPRERQIVQLIAEGSSNKIIGDKLSISVRTVETHRMNIMRKLGIQSVSELVRYAIRNHIIEP